MLKSKVTVVIVCIVVLASIMLLAINYINKKTIRRYILDTGYISGLGENNKKIISDYDTLKKYFEDNDIESQYKEKLTERYNESFFENNKLALVYISLSSGSAKLRITETKLEDSILYINYYIEMPEIGTTDMKGRVVVIEIPNEMGNVKDIKLVMNK